MICVIQRVASARVTADGKRLGEIGRGLLILAGVQEGDTPAHAAAFAEKCAALRIFPDESGRMNRSVRDVGDGVLAVPNFTLCADCRRGTRPSFSGARRPDEAAALYAEFVRRLEACAVRQVETGRFGADMRVALENDGPVTLVLTNADVNVQGKG